MEYFVEGSENLISFERAFKDFEGRLRACLGNSSLGWILMLNG